MSNPLPALRRLWESITEPRHLKVFYFGVYALATWIGTVTLLNPPTSIEGKLGTAITTFWAGLTIIGGVGALVTVLPGWWWLERLSVVLLIAGSLIYLGTAIYLDVIAPPGSSRQTQAGYIGLAIALFLLRLLLTRGWDYEPRRR